MAFATNLTELLAQQQPLDPELKMYMRDTGTFTVIQHPLVYAVPYAEAMNPLYNEQLKARRQELQKQLREKDYLGYIFWHEKPYRITALNEVKEKMNDKEYWQALGQVWENSENIWQNIKLWRKLLHSKRKHSEHFMDEDDREAFNKLPAEFTVYRGCTPKNENGYSYTLDVEMAAWFSMRFGNKNGDAKVIKRRVKKGECFAYLGGRNEQEIIILK